MNASTRFPLEPRQTVVVVRECLRKDFDCDGAAELQVRGLIHFSHAT